MIVKSNSNDPVLATLDLETIGYGPKYDQTIKDPYNSGPIVNPNSVPGIPTAQAKWSWWKFGLSVFAGLLSGGPAGALLAGIGYYAANKSVSLNSEEFGEISRWIQSTFIPFLNTLIVETNTLLENNFNSNSLNALNTLQSKLCILKNYYQNVNDDTMMSDEALALRYSMIEPFLTAIEGLLREEATGLGAGQVAVTVNTGNYNIPIFGQPITPINVQCANYQLGKGTVTTTPVVPTVEVPVTTKPTTTTPTPKKDNQLRNIMLIGFGTVAVILLLKDKKSTN